MDGECVRSGRVDEEIVVLRRERVRRRKAKGVDVEGRIGWRKRPEWRFEHKRAGWGEFGIERWSFGTGVSSER